MDGLIFTFVWAFDIKKDWDFVDKVREIVESNSGTVYFVELEADLEERMKRNKSPNRLEHKPTKRNIEWSETELKESLKKYRLNSYEGEVQKVNYIKIDNTNLTAVEVAEQIKETFYLS